MREAAQNLHSIAFKSYLENAVVDHWLDLLSFLNFLCQNLVYQPKERALQQINEKWGKNCGISRKKKKWQTGF